MFHAKRLPSICTTRYVRTMQKALGTTWCVQYGVLQNGSVQTPKLLLDEAWQSRPYRAAGLT